MLHQTTFLTIYILMITFILGCALGSFTDCLAGRMLNGTSVLKGRSHCDACGHVLGVLDLVPLFSRLCLRGRCRYCGAKIPAVAFWTELDFRNCMLPDYVPVRCLGAGTAGNSALDGAFMF